jgi:hypothetical protein
MGEHGSGRQTIRPVCPLSRILSQICDNYVWQAEVYGDDPANPATFNRASKAVMASDKLTASMSPRGGAVVWITKSAR